MLQESEASGLTGVDWEAHKVLSGIIGLSIFGGTLNIVEINLAVASYINELNMKRS